MAVSVLAAAATQTSSLGSKSTATNSAATHPSAPAATAPVTIQSKPAPHAINPSSNFSSLSSSPRQFPTDLTNSIPEEGDETESEPPNEPVTPVSGRQSQDFHTLTNPDAHPDAVQDSLTTDQEVTPYSNVRTGAAADSKPPLVLDTAISVTPKQQQQSQSAATATPVPTTPPADQEPTPVPLSRRSTRGSTSNFKRSMSNLFKRTNSNGEKALASAGEGETGTRKMPTRRWSMNKSSATTRSNTPPSPSSPLEMAVRTKEEASTPTVPANNEVFFAEKKKARASTGFSLRARVANVGSKSGKEKHQPPLRRRASSFDYSKQNKAEPEEPNGPVPIERALWGMPAESGTGVKARRMSLSLPDDFTVDVAELQQEFEFVHKFLGRHGKHLGKGATSKVTLMARKGIPGELYAVKEFRGKSSSETREEYEKKIKSEYTLAKSLHHPNIVETIRLCTDHGRWNHVMEYCQEGDLFSLVKKEYLKGDDREKDRQCLFKQLVQGINYLHSNGIAHRDIKLENLLMTSDSKLKITDFGVSEVFSGIHPGIREAGGRCGEKMGEVRRCPPGICGSEPYIAPEVLKKSRDYDPRALDVWSSAIVMLHLIFGAPLWRRAEWSGQPPKEGQSNVYANLCMGWDKWNDKHRNIEHPVLTDVDYPYVRAFDLCVKPPALRRVILQMLNPDPDKRITIADVVKNRWVKGIECCQLESYDDPSTTIDASKKASLKCGGSKTFCHNHLPPKAEFSSHSLGKMPGSAGY